MWIRNSFVIVWVSDASLLSFGVRMGSGVALGVGSVLVSIRGRIRFWYRLGARFGSGVAWGSDSVLMSLGGRFRSWCRLAWSLVSGVFGG